MAQIYIALDLDGVLTEDGSPPMFSDKTQGGYLKSALRKLVADGHTLHIVPVTSYREKMDAKFVQEFYEDCGLTPEAGAGFTFVHDHDKAIKAEAVVSKLRMALEQKNKISHEHMFLVIDNDPSRYPTEHEHLYKVNGQTGFTAEDAGHVYGAVVAQLSNKGIGSARPVADFQRRGADADYPDMGARHENLDPH